MKPSPLLHTKFMVPPVRNHLPRPHLIQWLDDQTERRLILISAPPGYGKTTLLVDFITGLSRPVAWYQLETTDSDPTVFLTYLIEAIRRAKSRSKKVAGIGQNAQSLLDSAEAGMEPQRVLTVLINEIAEHIADSLTIVLEDYHYVASPVVHQLVDYLLENAPPTVRVIISTRADPPLSLARLRARGLLSELRSADLRFRDEEISALLQHEIHDIPADSLASLSEKTEGWVAALQIIRNSLTGKDAEAARVVINSLSGSNRFIFEYLVEEVFQRQPKERQDFLLRSAILSQMDAASCNALAQIQNAQSVLEDLERQNLFVSGLDAERRWYRYHFLFREFLLSRLRRENGGQVSDLERRAGKYYEEQGEMEAAFGHYVAAADFEPAARAASAFAADYVERGRVEVLHLYLKMLPAETMHAHPQLL